ncbi:type IX secretion system protein PorG [Yeosuana sp.]|uniref:type IX secretion system protein PorG n=1 Tax=Yeosuana sp. TaxID=2529388 RepID=UPI004054AE05|tara:strand:+ start:5626 stop:6312 length:687 start_codon:yes stop_codon:yes gene_type:complete
MKYITIIIISILSVHSSYSQINEIGVFIGGSNFIGDVGATNYISPNQLAFGGVYKWNRSPRHSYRISLTLTDLEGKDSKSDDPRRIQRNYGFSNKITEISAGMEFTFFDFNLHSGKRVSTPYIYSGISVANHKDSYFLNGLQNNQGSSSWAFGIPMALGFKTSFLQSFVLGFEIGARFTFSDNLDGSFPKDASLQPYRFGNQNNNDWYTFSGITLTYTFGQNPCYCVK